MSMPKLLLLITAAIFCLIGVKALTKNKKNDSEIIITDVSKPISVVVDNAVVAKEPVVETPKEIVIEKKAEPVVLVNEPDIDRIDELFNIEGRKLPIVETITYKSKVDWSPGKSAWISDYASHYHTSRHFIARSLNGSTDYFKQDVANGDKFNVFRGDKKFEFNLLVDVDQCKMWFFYHDISTNEKVLLKTYKVSLGRQDPTKASGLLTPLGKYSLGDRVAIYHPTTTGFHNGKKQELIKIFGTRWIPFEKEICNCTAGPKGFGIHGVPWVQNEKGELKEDLSSLGKYSSDGCIRLATDDINELYSIIITKPTTIEIVRSSNQLASNKAEDK